MAVILPVSPEVNRAIRGAGERSRELRLPRAADQEKHGDLVVEAMMIPLPPPERGTSVVSPTPTAQQLLAVCYAAPRWLAA